MSLGCLYTHTQLGKSFGKACMMVSVCDEEGICHSPLCDKGMEQETWGVNVKIKLLFFWSVPYHSGGERSNKK